MKNKIFTGSGVAIVTPFMKDDAYKIDYDSYKNLLDYQLLNQTDAIIVSGTTGESSTLTSIEKGELIKYTIERVNKKVPVIAGTGCNDTRIALRHSIQAENLKVDGLLMVTPYYNKCTQEGLYQHYKYISDNVHTPIILYNVPSRTGVNILPETVKRLSELDNIVGIKEASGNLEQVKKIKELVSNDFAIYSGNDDQIYSILDLGGNGVISVLANIMPQETHNMCMEYLNGNKEKSLTLQKKYLELIKALFIEVNPIPIKKALEDEKIIKSSNLRLPLTQMSTDNHKILKKALHKIDK